MRTSHKPKNCCNGLAKLSLAMDTERVIEEKCHSLDSDEESVSHSTIAFSATVFLLGRNFLKSHHSLDLNLLKCQQMCHQVNAS